MLGTIASHMQQWSSPAASSIARLAISRDSLEAASFCPLSLRLLRPSLMELCGGTHVVRRTACPASSRWPGAHPGDPNEPGEEIASPSAAVFASAVLLEMVKLLVCALSGGAMEMAPPHVLAVF